MKAILAIILLLISSSAYAAKPKRPIVYFPGHCSAEWQKKRLAQGRDYRCKSYEALE
jgi:hypothetical protein